MDIVICDDDKLAIARTIALLQAFFESQGHVFRHKFFLSGEEMVRHAGRLKNADLFILDYKMQGITGVEAAAALREQGITAKVVFVSSVVEAAPQGYEVNAFRYVLKNADFEENFTACMSRVLSEYRLPKQSLTFNFNRQSLSVALQDIMYIECMRHKLILHMAPGRCERDQYEFYGQLADIHYRLPEEYFLRVYRSYIVNLQYVERIQGRPHYIVGLTGSIQLPVSRNNFSDIKKTVLVWLSNEHS